MIDGTLVAPGLLIWVAISKYPDHLPLYCLEPIPSLAGEGWDGVNGHGGLYHQGRHLCHAR